MPDLSTSPTNGSRIITCRLAKDNEGELVHSLIQCSVGSIWDWIDWTQSIGASWIIGEVNGIPQGCIQVSPGFPLGRVDMLSINPHLPKRYRALLARDLGYAAWNVCRHAGSQGIMSMIEASSENDWLVIAIKRGYVPYGQGTFLVKPLL